MNKLTPEKFQKLSDDLLKLDLNSSKILNGVILLIFDKALDEPKYSSMYAQLCKRIEKELETDIDKTKSSTFLQILLNVCRDKFENRVQYSEKIINSELALTDDLEEKKNVAKQKILGNVKFIGELYKLDMLGEPHLHKMLRSLFTNKSSATTEKNCEDMECLAQLIKTCGKNLDTELGKQLMDQYFDRMEQYSQSSKFPPRIRFLLRDLIELRKNTWTPRKVARVEGPAPIQELTNEDDLVLRPAFGMRGRDYRNQERGDQRDWISKFSLNPLNFNDSFSLLSSSPSPLLPSSYSSSPNGYGNRDHRDNRGDNRGGGGGNYRMHNNRNGDQNQHSSYHGGNGGGGGGGGGSGGMRYNNNNNNNNNGNSSNNSNMNMNKHNSHHDGGRRDGGGSGGGGMNHHHQNNGGGSGGLNSHNSSYSNSRDGMINNKDLAPRFKRNMMPQQNPVEDLQMRPTANSLLFKTQNMSMKTQLPISQTPSSQSSKSSSYNSPQLGDFSSPLTTRTLLSEQRAAASGNSAFGANVSSNSSYNQSSSTSASNYGSGSGGASAGGSTGASLGNTGSAGQQTTSNNSSPLTGQHSQLTRNSLNNQPSVLNGKSPANALVGSSPATPINNILQKDQVIIKQASAEKAEKKNKKDKGPNKEEFMKKVSVFTSEVLLENLKKQIEEDKLGKPKDPPVENGAVQEIVVEVVDQVLNPDPDTVNEADFSEKTEDDKSSEKTDVGSETEKSETEDKSVELSLMDELVNEYYELKVPEKFMRDSVSKIVNEVLDKSDPFHEKTIEFLQKLRKDGKLANGATLEAFKALINSMNEKEKTIPKITTIVASLLSRAVSVRLCKLSDISNYTDSGQHYPLFLLVLQQLHKQLGKPQLQEMFQQSKVNLMSSLPECDRTKDRMAEILEDRNLSFLYPLLRVQAELWKQIQADSNPQQFYKWIKENVEANCYTDPGFITAVMTVLLKFIMQESSKFADEKQAVEKEMDILKKYCPVLNAFLNGNIELQLVAIYAMQVYWYSIDFPKGVLLRWFRESYELSVIEEEAFLRYKEDVTDMYPGKGKALFQVNQWLTWLAEAEDEDEEDEE